MTPELQEALSNQHSVDTFQVLVLSTGRLAVFGREFVGFAGNWQELLDLAPRAQWALPKREPEIPVVKKLLNVEIEL